MKDNKNQENEMQYMPIGMCIGIGIGTAIGAATGNIPMFMSAGLSLGMCIGLLIDRKNRISAESAKNADDNNSEKEENE